jgi:hypothetical protein
MLLRKLMTLLLYRPKPEIGSSWLDYCMKSRRFIMTEPEPQQMK